MSTRENIRLIARTPYVVIIEFTDRVYRKSVLFVLFSFVYFFTKYALVESV